MFHNDYSRGLANFGTWSTGQYSNVRFATWLALTNFHSNDLKNSCIWSAVDDSTINIVLYITVIITEIS